MFREQCFTLHIQWSIYGKHANLFSFDFDCLFLLTTTYNISYLMLIMTSRLAGHRQTFILVNMPTISYLQYVLFLYPNGYGHATCILIGINNIGILNIYLSIYQLSDYWFYNIIKRWWPFISFIY